MHKGDETEQGDRHRHRPHEEVQLPETLGYTEESPLLDQTLQTHQGRGTVGLRQSRHQTHQEKQTEEMFQEKEKRQVMSVCRLFQCCIIGSV